MRSTLAGTTGLIRYALRRDRVYLTVWLFLLTVTVYASAVATTDLYPTAEERAAAATAINASGAVVALYGPIVDVTSSGELAMTKLTVLYALLVAWLAVTLVRRHTRAEEESGRAELLGSAGVGRDALLAAAVLQAVGVCVVVGVLAAAADIAGGLPVLGSVAFGVSWAGVGLVGVGIGAVACQLSASSRTCAGLAGAALAVLYLLRAVGDLGPEAASWASPLGWATRLHAWQEPRWWMVGLYVGAAATLLAVAGRLSHRRDLGSGLLAARPGPARGAPRLSDGLVLAWRVHRPGLVWWSVSVGVLGSLFGAIAPGVQDLLDTEQGRAMIESLGGPGALEEALISAILAMMAVVVTGFALTVVGRGSVDEAAGRTEQVLATAVTRSQTFAAVLLVAGLGSAWLMAVTGLATGLGLGRDVAGLTAAGLAQVPAIWVVLALASLAVAVRGSWAWVGWGWLVFFLLISELGDLLSLPDWVMWLSPYTHSAAMPSEPFEALPAVALGLLAIVLAGTAWWRYAERDIG